MKSRKRARKAPGQVSKAARLYERFSGHEARAVDRIDFRVPSSAVVVGMCDGILYTTRRDGKQEAYIHRFKGSAKPLFAVSPDGRQIIFIGGRYRFTERGIVDQA